MNISELRSILRRHPDVDVCFNNNGFKVGRKGTDQRTWKRYSWRNRLTVDNLSRIIDTAAGIRVSPPTTPPPTSHSPTTHEVEEPWIPFGLENENSDDIVITEVEEMSGANVQRILRGLGAKEMRDLKSFIRFAKKEGYIKKDASFRELTQLVTTWWKNHK